MQNEQLELGMKRILIGLIALAVLGAAGWFGFNLYVQHRATAEVEAAFEQMRSGGGKASHGKVAFELASRTLTVEDIDVEPGQHELAHVTIAKATAVGVRQADEARFSADSIEVAGLEVAITYAERAKMKANYKAPQIIARDFSGPIHAAAAPPSGSMIDAYRFVLAQYATITASSITAPTITVDIDAGTGNTGSGAFVYSGVAIQNVNRGKVETTKTDRITYTLDVSQPGRPDKMTGELSNFAAHDFDASALGAALDPQQANDDGFHGIYRRLSAGAYVMTSAQGMRARVDGFTVDGVAIQPAKFRPAEILALVPTDRSASPTPAQSRDLIDKLAGFFEGFQIDKAEIGKVSVETPQGPARLNAVKYDQNEFALEGFDAPTPQGPFRMERFALKSFKTASLLRWVTSLANPGQPPSLARMLGLFGVFDGAEIKGVTAPYKTTKKLVTIDTLSVDWGQMLGSIPSKAHVLAKLVTPTDASDPKQLALIAGGLDKLAIDLNLGVAWTEQSNSFVLAPAALDIAGVAKAELRVALGNVPREIFSAEPAQVMGQAARVEAGAIELSLRDSGLTDLVVAQFARMQNVSRDAARQALVDSVKAQREQIVSANPDAGAAVDAIARFVETPGQALAIKLAPRAKAPLMQLMQLLQTDPQSALAQFRIEASTGL